MVGVAASSRSSVVPDPRPLRDPKQAFSGEEQRVGHRARFSRPGHAQRHEETLQQKGRSLAAGGRGEPRSVRCNGQSTRLLQFRDPNLVSGDPGWDFPSQEDLAHTLRKAATCGDWAFQVTKVMVFIKSHTQQAVSAAAADSARCWRQWAKEACQGSAGAAHGFSKVGLDDGEGGGLAGPQLLVKQVETWLPLWLDSRRANAKRLADQEDVGEPSKRSTMCKTYKSTAGLGHDCTNPKAILQLPVELRVRFIDLLMAFEALVKPLSCSHMMVLRPKPSGGHRTIGLTVAPLRVLSRLRRPLAQKSENDHDATYFWGCQGKACGPCRLGALDHGGGSEGAAAVGGLPATGLAQVLRARWTRPPLGRTPENQFSHATPGLFVRFIRRLAFPRGRQMRHFSLSGPLGPLFQVAERRPLAQQWENEHDAPYFWGLQGKACDRAAWAHSIMVAAAKGRQQSAASPPLDLAKFCEHAGHDHLWEEGHKTSFPRRLLAS